MFGLPLNGDDVLTNLILIVIVYVIAVLMQKLKKENYPLLFCYSG